MRKQVLLAKMLMILTFTGFFSAFSSESYAQCSVATTINCGDIVTGSTVGLPSDFLDCGTFDGTGGEVWYALTGTGGDVTATTCNAGTDYDTKIWVYSGSCASLTCVTGNDDDIACGFSGLRSTVTFPTTLGETYYIIVGGFSANEGNYEMSVTCASPPPPPCIIGAGCATIPPAEVTCCEAWEETVALDPFCCNTGWDQICTNGYLAQEAIFCPPPPPCTIGAGCVVVPPVEVTCCEAWEETVALDPFCCNTGWDQICTNGYLAQEAIFCPPPPACTIGAGCVVVPPVEVTCCEAWEETVALDPFCCNTGWDQICTNGYLAQEAIFCPPPPPGPCDFATPIACGAVVTGSTVGAPTDAVSDCITTNGTGGKVWYEFTGTGELVTATTCGAGTSYDTKLWVFSGDCNNLVCVTGNDDDFTCGFSVFQSNVEFLSTLGETYYIVVGGFAANEGNYELTITCAPAPVIPDCATNIIVNVPACGPGSIEISWDPVAGADDFNIYLGTAPGLNDLANPFLLENQNNVFLNNPTFNTTFYMTVVPVNFAGEAIGCIEFSFVSQDVCPPPPVCIIGDGCAVVPPVEVTCCEAWQATVALDPFCCNTDWDFICQQEYDAQQAVFCPPCAIGAGCAVVPPVEVTCCEAWEETVALDPFCCEIGWDQICTNGYNAQVDIFCPPANLPECAQNINVNIPGCGPGSVEISWDPVVDATNFNIYAGTAPGLNDLANPFALGNQNNVFLNLPPVAFNTTIYMTVVPTNGLGEAIGCTEFSFVTQDACTPPANDDICDATDVTNSIQQDLNTYAFLADMTCDNNIGNNSNGTPSPVGPSCGAANGNDTWYSFTTPNCAVGGSVPFTIELTTNNPGTNYDTKIALFISDDNTCTGNMTEVICNDDNAFGGNPALCGANPSFLVSAIVIDALLPNTQYWVYVGGFNGSTGTYELSGRALAPAHGVAPAGGGTQVQLTTTDMGASLYTYYYKLVGSTGYSTFNSASALTDTRTLAPGNDYITQIMYRCDANFFNQNQWYRTEPQTITLENQCALVNDMTCTFNGPNSYTLTWTEPSGDLFTNNGALSGYRIKRNPVGSTGVYTFSNPAVVCENGVCSVTLPGNSPTGFNWTIETRCSANTVQVGNTTSCGPAPQFEGNNDANNNTDRTSENVFSFVNAETGVEFVDVQMFDAYADFGLNTPMIGDYEMYVNSKNEITWRRIDASTDFDFDFIIVPNPTNAMTTVYLNTIVESGSYTVIDAMGRTINTGSIDNTDNIDLDATQLQSGVYMVVVTVGNQQLTRRLVVAN